MSDTVHDLEQGATVNVTPRTLARVKRELITNHIRRTLLDAALLASVRMLQYEEKQAAKKQQQAAKKQQQR